MIFCLSRLLLNFQLFLECNILAFLGYNDTIIGHNTAKVLYMLCPKNEAKAMT